MKAKKGSRGILCLLLICMLSILAGCSGGKDKLTKNDNEMNTVLLKEDGSVESLVTEEFGDSYDAEGLQAFVQETIDAYNSVAGEDSVTLKDIEVEDGTAVMILAYSNVDSFRDFNGMELGVTVGNHAEELPETFRNAKGETADASQALTDKYTVAFLGLPEEGENPYRLMVQGKIAYYAGGELDGKYTVTGNGTEKIYVIYK